MNVIMLGVGDYGASNQAGDVVKTLALGSCVAVTQGYTQLAWHTWHCRIPASALNGLHKSRGISPILEYRPFSR